MVLRWEENFQKLLNAKNNTLNPQQEIPIPSMESLIPDAKLGKVNENMDRVKNNKIYFQKYGKIVKFQKNDVKRRIKRGNSNGKMKRSLDKRHK